MSEPKYAQRWRGIRCRVTATPHRGEWSLGIARSRWPMPKPSGMVLYVIHALWWNVCFEIALPPSDSPRTTT